MNILYSCSSLRSPVSVFCKGSNTVLEISKSVTYIDKNGTSIGFNLETTAMLENERTKCEGSGGSLLSFYKVPQ